MKLFCNLLSVQLRSQRSATGNIFKYCCRYFMRSMDSEKKAVEQLFKNNNKKKRARYPKNCFEDFKTRRILPDTAACACTLGKVLGSTKWTLAKARPTAALLTLGFPLAVLACRDALNSHSSYPSYCQSCGCCPSAVSDAGWVSLGEYRSKQL